jgi:hypothetical protein
MALSGLPPCHGQVGACGPCLEHTAGSMPEAGRRGQPAAGCPAAKDLASDSGKGQGTLAGSFRWARGALRLWRMPPVDYWSQPAPLALARVWPRNSGSEFDTDLSLACSVYLSGSSILDRVFNLKFDWARHFKLFFQMRDDFK